MLVLIIKVVERSVGLAFLLDSMLWRCATVLVDGKLDKAPDEQ